MRHAYSRLASTEEKRNIRKAFIFSILTLAAIVFIFVFGIPTIVKFAGFLTDLRKSSLPIDKNDTTPPSPPRISTLPDATNKANLDVAGTAEAGATVIFTFNENSQETVVANDGTFTFSLALEKGENKLSFIAKDPAGNESQKTPVYTVIFDDDKPKLEITSPANEAEFFGSKQRQVAIRGVTEPETSLTINDRLIKVDDSGNFTYATTLNEGENNFSIKATDKAGNLSEQTLMLRFSP